MWSSKSGKQICGVKRSEAITFERMLIGRGSERAFWSAGNVLHIDLSSGYTGIHIYKNQSSFRFKICTFYCKLYLNETFF